MPQMAPTLWASLLITFFVIFCALQTYFYFVNSPIISDKTCNKNKYEKLNWLW